jgi:hypothetical protein
MHGPFGAFTSVLLPYILGQGCGYEHDYSARNEARRAKWVEKHKGKAQVVEGGDPIRLTGLHVPLGVFNEHRKSSTGPEPKDFSCTGLHTPTYRALACPTPLQSEQASRDPAKEDMPVGRALPSAQRTL